METFRPPEFVDKFVSKNWSEWKRKFKLFLKSSGMSDSTDEDLKINLLLTYIGDEGLDTYNTWSFKDQERTLDNVLKKFTDHYASLMSVTLQTFKFHSLKQSENQSIDDFYAVLKKQANFCSFKCHCCNKQYEERMIRDQLILGLSSKSIRERLIKDGGVKLANTMVLARTLELCEKYAEVGAVNVGKRKKSTRKLHRKNSVESMSKNEMDDCIIKSEIYEMDAEESSHQVSLQEPSYQDLNQHVNKYDSGCREIQSPKINSSCEEMSNLGYTFEASSKGVETILPDVLVPDTDSSLDRLQHGSEVKSTELKTEVTLVKNEPVEMTPDVQPNIRKFTCDRCGVTFASRSEFEDHYAFSSICSKPLHCYLCSYSTDRNATLKLHLAFEHNQTDSQIPSSEISIEPRSEHLPFEVNKNKSIKTMSHKQNNKSSFNNLYKESFVTKSLNKTKNSLVKSISKCNKEKFNLSLKGKHNNFACFYCGYMTRKKASIKVHIKNKHCELFTK